MTYLVVQIAALLSVAVVVGLIMGWWGAKFTYQAQQGETLATLTQLTQQQQETLRENTTLRLRLTQAEQALVQARQAVPLHAEHVTSHVENHSANQVTPHTTTVFAPQPLAILEPETPDDFTLIQGINQRVADTLRALGIVKYYQIAEFTADDVNSIRGIIASEDSLPLEQWVETAQVLCQQQCQQIPT